jgi:peroxiredoxin
MSSVKTHRVGHCAKPGQIYWGYLCMAALLFSLQGCGNNLVPDGSDKRLQTPGSVGQNAPVFSISDVDGNIVTLPAALSGKSGIVLYFTMWCSICDVHMDHIRSVDMPAFPNVGFYLVDYVSVSVADARTAALSDGFYGTAGLTVLAGFGNAVVTDYDATMGTTVVIDSSGVIRMNEDFKDGARLQSVLSALP